LASRLAIVLSHPTQYYSPWFRDLAKQVTLKVYYLWDFGIRETEDKAFQASFTWDIPLLDGYDHEFLPNRSPDPGTHHFRGLDNPGAAEEIAAWEPDAILLFGYNYATHLSLILAPQLRGIPLLFRGDSHELFPAGGWKAAASRMVRRLLFKRFSRFLAVGKANVGYFRRSGVPGQKIAVVPHCVDNGRFQAAAEDAEIEAAAWKRGLGIPDAAVVILFAGKFEQKKRPLDLLTAFRAMESGLETHSSEVSDQRSPRDQAKSSAFRRPPPCLLFVGGGPLESRLRAEAGDRLGKSIFFAPFQNQSQMPKVYAAGEVLVLPSFGRGETWGLAVNEAMNLARPAIVSTHVGCRPDLILEGDTGWSFPAGDVEALARVLRKAVSDPERLVTMGRRARAHVANYSYQAATSELLRALEQVMSARAEVRCRRSRTAI
jgi:glycosyltransferase involved in cell wall biosynthesis